ncbi:unnamed protein product [Orchesella dallaii]|uniref:Uncharacterized protein n=1 Tax=Orchesella dallaii TaxID=48710 RepID=A0ABP1RBV8_9HEXA
MASKKIQSINHHTQPNWGLSISILICFLVTFNFPACAHVNSKVQVIHPLQTMVFRATHLSPIVFYGRHGRVHMKYQPVLPKVLYTVGVIGEIMRGVGSTVSEVAHRAVVKYPGHNYEEPYSSYYTNPYYHPERRSQGRMPQMQLATSLSRPRFVKPPRRNPRPPTPPRQNMLELISKAIAGAR